MTYPRPRTVSIRSSPSLRRKRFTKTAMVEKMPENIIEQMKSIVALQRLGVPKDIANAYLFLASSESDYVNGHVLHVDGGIMM